MSAADLDAAWSAFIASRKDINSATEELDEQMEVLRQALDTWLEIKQRSSKPSEVNFTTVSLVMNRLEALLRTW